MSSFLAIAIVGLGLAGRTAQAFQPARAAAMCHSSARRGVVVRMEEKKEGGFFGRMLQGLDDMVDDALDRKLGNGASFYGKRKSNFYGNNDAMKKKDPRKADASEDYRGNKGGSYFVWDKEWNVPLTKKQARMKKKGVLNNPFAIKDDD